MKSVKWDSNQTQEKTTLSGDEPYHMDNTEFRQTKAAKSLTTTNSHIPRLNTSIENGFRRFQSKAKR